jgi:hypothetical protein
VLAESRDWLHGVQDLPLVLQHASLKARGAETRPLPALAAHRLRAQVLSRAHDGRLFEILEAFERQTGVGVLGAIAFCVFGWDVADEPRRAIESFLVSSVDHLLLDGVLLGKAAGREAPQNLLPFRPRLSMRAQMLDGTGAGSAKPVVVSVRSWTGRRQLMRMNAEIRPILALCDGNRTVAEIVDRVRGSFPAGGDLSNQVGGLLRTLHRRRAVCFVAPPAEPVT